VKVRGARGDGEHAYNFRERAIEGMRGTDAGDIWVAAQLLWTFDMAENQTKKERE